jgi:hypothetical protein
MVPPAASGQAPPLVATQAKPAAPAPVVPATAQPAPVRVTTNADPVNIRFEIRIREEGGTAKPITKTVIMTGTLGDVSIVRSNTAPGPVQSYLNVDVTPTAIGSNKKLRTKIGIEYAPSGADPIAQSAPAGPRGPQIRQTVHTWLDSGKPMVISESVDPGSDRRFIVEVTATVLP